MEHNADGFEHVPEAVSVLRLPCSVEHVKNLLQVGDETQLGRELRESDSRPGVQSAVQPVRKRVQVALDLQQRCTRGIAAWDKLKNGGWLLCSTGIRMSTASISALEPGRQRQHSTWGDTTSNRGRGSRRDMQGGRVAARQFGQVPEQDEQACVHLEPRQEFHQGDFSVGEVGEAGVDTRDFNDVIF